MEIFQLPTTKCEAPRYKPYEQSETHAKRMRHDKTDEVILFLLKI